MTSHPVSLLENESSGFVSLSVEVAVLTGGAVAAVGVLQLAHVLECMVCAEVVVGRAHGPVAATESARACSRSSGQDHGHRRQVFVKKTCALFTLPDLI
jgi:hypothetical protein